jgi:hypothetical protein
LPAQAASPDAQKRGVLRATQLLDVRIMALCDPQQPVKLLLGIMTP